MSNCFVIQPFDGGPFDKRYDDIIAPAIQDAGLEAYRVDRDPSVIIPIVDIEKGIRQSAVCLADISTDNPNVWFELGFALAAGKEVVLVGIYAPGRRFPFDIQHRAIIVYKTESSRDFKNMRKEISDRLEAILAKEVTLDKVGRLSPIADVQGLSANEMVALVSIAGNVDTPDGTTSLWTIRQDMERAGYTRVALTLAIAALLDKDMVVSKTEEDRNGEPFTVYGLTSKGMDWLQRNQDKLVLKTNKASPPDGVEELPF